MRCLFFAPLLLLSAACAAPPSDDATPNDERIEATDDALTETNREFIEQVADAAGEYFDYGSTAYASALRRVPFSDLPEKLRAVAEQRVAEERESVRAATGGPASTSDAFLGDDHYRIIRNGRTVGYVVTIDHAIDHPLWDGSGQRVFYDVYRRVVVDVGWSG